MVNGRLNDKKPCYWVAGLAYSDTGIGHIDKVKLRWSQLVLELVTYLWLAHNP